MILGFVHQGKGMQTTTTMYRQTVRTFETKDKEENGYGKRMIALTKGNNLDIESI
jgi:hypothetical protein